MRQTRKTGAENSDPDSEFFAHYDWDRFDYRTMVVVLGALVVATIGNLIVLGLMAYDGINSLWRWRPVRRRAAVDPAE